MAITTTDQLCQYLTSRKIFFTNVTPLPGGSSNYVWRIIKPSGQYSILKHAEPFLASNHETPFPLNRMDFEAHALETIPKLIPEDEIIRLPALLQYDKDNRILELEHVGENTLHKFYQDPKLDVRMVGERIGRWLARLHASTTNDEVKRGFDHSTAKLMYRWNYNSLSLVLERYGFDPTLGERINAKYGALLQTDDTCVCHGDLWPGNVLLPDMELDFPTQEFKFSIIDWEVARSGNGMTDVGHFAGESWFLDRFRGGRGLLASFLRAYVVEKELGPNDKERIAAQFGTHITFWPTIYVSTTEVKYDIYSSLISFYLLMFLV
jgi:thiamine kinase-like enzyme